MKKYFSAILAVTFIVALCGCGDNKTKEKLYGTSLISASNPGGGNNGSSSSASSADMASAAVFAAQMGTDMVSYYTTLAAAPRRHALRKAGMPEIRYDSMTGNFAISYSGYEMVFSFLDISGHNILFTDQDHMTGGEIDSIKAVKLTMTSGAMNISMTMSTTEPMDGNISITSGGVTYTCTITDLTYNGSGNITGGGINVRCGGWTVALTFSNDGSGSANGTITGPNYSATVSISSDGTGTYTDSEGPHQIS